MPTIIYVQPDGTRQEILVADGKSIMQGAVQNGIDGILAECGGSALCGTCHVYVEPSRLSSLPPPSDDEEDLLDATASERLANSRLSCQVKVTAAMDGLEVVLPERQV